MSEVKRYTPDQLSGRTLAVVLSDDYNTLELEAVRLRADNQNYDRLLGRANINLDTAQSQLAALREESVTLRAGMKGDYDLDAWLEWTTTAKALREELATYKLAVTRLGGTVEKVASVAKFNKDAGEDLQQRLADAERRNSERDAQLSKATAFVERLFASAGNQPSIATGYLRDILDTLNPNPEAASHE